MSQESSRGFRTTTREGQETHLKRYEEAGDEVGLFVSIGVGEG